MKILKKLLLVLAVSAGLAVLVGAGYFARERYQHAGPLVFKSYTMGGRTADETMALLVTALGKKDTEAAQHLYNQDNKEGYSTWATILQTNATKGLLDVMSKSIAAAIQYGPATSQLKRFAIINKLRTEGLIFSITPNAKLGLWQISDLARAQLLQKKTK